MKRTHAIIIALVIIGVIAFFFIAKPYCADPEEPAVQIQQQAYEVSPFQVENYQDNIAYFPSGLELGPVNGIEDAVEKAKAVWSEKYADSFWVQECVSTSEWPVLIFFDYKNCCWFLCGKLPPRTLGGTPCIIFDSEGNVLALWHGQ